MDPLPGRSAPDIGVWIEQPGLPADAPTPQSSALGVVDAVVDGVQAGRILVMDVASEDWTTQHWLRFLRALPDDLSVAQMSQFDDTFGFSETGNSEILSQWLILSIRHGYGGADARLEEFLTGMGRRKFLKPIYEELVKTPEGPRRLRERC